jgi:hypothetical protein
MKNGHINSEKSEHQAMKVRWSQIGTYRVIGSTCDWVCKIALHRHKNGLWSARWKGEVAVYYSPQNGDSDEGEGYIGGIQSLIESPKCP